jgi:hypothetical protein
MERATEILCVAESKRQSDVVVRELGCAEIVQRNLGTEFVQQATIGKTLLSKLAT